MLYLSFYLKKLKLFLILVTYLISSCCCFWLSACHSAQRRPEDRQIEEYKSGKTGKTGKQRQGLREDCIQNIRIGRLEEGLAIQRYEECIRRNKTEGPFLIPKEEKYPNLTFQGEVSNMRMKKTFSMPAKSQLNNQLQICGKTTDQ